MPFTPFHWGPSSVIGFLFYRRLHFLAFLIANVIVDIEPLLVLIFKIDYPLHGFFHSFLGASFVAMVLAYVLHKLQPVMAVFTRPFRLEQTFSFAGLLAVCLLGVYFHVFLDSFLYKDIQPFFPSGWNPFYNKISHWWMYVLCTGSFMVSSILYMLRKGTPWFGNVIAFSFAVLVALFLFVAFPFLKPADMKSDEGLIAVWKNHLSEFTQMAESCDWSRDENYKYSNLSKECKAMARKYSLNPHVYSLDGHRYIQFGNEYQGYIYSPNRPKSLRKNLDGVAISDIEPYSSIYRAIGDRWYIYKSNPSD